jgi:DNA polymerase-3 subunit beta
MKVSVLQDKLAKGLGIVARAVESRPTLPVLGNVLLATEDARVKLSATNRLKRWRTWSAISRRNGSI